MCFLGVVVLIGFIVTDFVVCVLLLGVARFVWVCGFFDFLWCWVVVVVCFGFCCRGFVVCVVLLIKLFLFWIGFGFVLVGGDL